MIGRESPRNLLPFLLSAAAAMVTLGWLLSYLFPHPYSGYLAVVVVGLAATELFKRRPEQQARRMFRVYLRARERGADEAAARERLLARLWRDPTGRQAVAAEIQASWVGASERDRATAGITRLLARRGRPLDLEAVVAAWNRERDRFLVPGWDALPAEFVQAVRARLDAREREQLERLMDKYQLYRQRFFRSSTALGAVPAASAADFARLLHSMGNRLTKQHPGDAERAYRLSLRLRPDENLAHSGLALLLEQTGRVQEAVEEAKVALDVLASYAARAAERPPTTEDISPFRSPATLREALERLIRSGPTRGR